MRSFLIPLLITSLAIPLYSQMAPYDAAVRASFTVVLIPPDNVNVTRQHLPTERDIELLAALHTQQFAAFVHQLFHSDDFRRDGVDIVIRVLPPQDWCPDCIFFGVQVRPASIQDLPAPTGGYAGPKIFSALTTRNGSTNEADECGHTTSSPCFVSTLALHTHDQLTCSGVLVAPDKVLSAAHCFCAGRPSYATFGNQVRFSIYRESLASVHYLLGDEVSFYQDAFCSEYRDFLDGNAPYPSGDLALISLNIPLAESTPSGRSPYAVIGSQPLIESVTEVVVVGYGAREDDPIGGEKYYAEIPIESADCSPDASGSGHDSVGKYRCHRGQEMVAVDRRNPVQSDSCTGDSGGGAYARTSDDSFALVAIVSRSVPTTHVGVKSCGPGGIYPLLTTDEVRAWLREVAPGIRVVDPD